MNETETSSNTKKAIEILVCRICVVEKDTRPISEVDIELEHEKWSMRNVLKAIGGLQLTGCTMFHICSICVENATNAFKFKVLCEKSNEKFDKYLKDGKSETEEIERVLLKTENVLDTTIKVEKEEEYSDDDIPLINFTNDEFDSDSENTKSTTSLRKKDGKCLKTVNRKIRRRKTKRQNDTDYCADDIQCDEITKCKFCNKLFKNKYVLVAHEKRHENKGKFICNECGKGFDSKGCLNRHTRVHTGEKKFQCTDCQRCFPSANNLRLHSRRHNGIKPYLCTQCGKSFSHPTGLSYHLRTHTRERPYTCEICGKSFLVQCHLDRHKKIHTGERPFACTQCERAFIKKIDLQRHEAIHSGERPHTCKVCNKAFLRILHLNYHMMVHTSERPHRCHYCGKGFIRKYYLTDHIKKRHGEDILMDTK